VIDKVKPNPAKPSSETFLGFSSVNMKCSSVKRKPIAPHPILHHNLLICVSMMRKVLDYSSFTGEIFLGKQISSILN
jgi:hypothetical protein